MVRLTVLFLCIFFTATRAQFLLESNDIPESYEFPGFIVLRGSHLFARLGDTRSCPVKPWTEAQAKARTRRLLVEFTAPFEKTPFVSYTITQLDMDARYNTRYVINLVAVSSSAFILEYGIWCNTVSYSAVVTFSVTGVISKAASENGAEALSYTATEISSVQL